MKPVVMLRGKRPVYDHNENKVTIQFFFPSTRVNTILGIQAESGEIDLINGDVPRIIVKAGARVELDRMEIERKEDQRKMKKK